MDGGIAVPCTSTDRLPVDDSPPCRSREYILSTILSYTLLYSTVKKTRVFGADNSVSGVDNWVFGVGNSFERFNNGTGTLFRREQPILFDHSFIGSLGDYSGESFLNAAARQNTILFKNLSAEEIFL